jgi:hypothetical protein
LLLVFWGMFLLFLIHWVFFLILKGCWISSSFFSVTTKIFMFFVLHSVHVFDHLYWFAYVEPFSCPWNESYVTILYDLFM